MNDTIAAISTALGKGAISIIRVSGDDAILIVNKIFKGTDLTTVESHTIHYGHIVNKDELVDEVLVSIMKAPKTFTKEDIVEFLALAAPNAQKKGGFWWGTRVGRLLIVSLIVVILTIIVWICTSGQKDYGLYVFGTFFYACFMGFTSVLVIDKETLNHNVRAEVWKSKFDQVMIKARSLRGDPEFTQQLDYYEYMVNSQN